jgi:hypothetical protein
MEAFLLKGFAFFSRNRSFDFPKFLFSEIDGNIYGAGNGAIFLGNAD